MDTTVAALCFMPQGTAEWHELTKGPHRIFEITASVAPNIVGVGYVSPKKQWEYDMGLDHPQDNFTAELQRRGVEDEDAVVDRFLSWWQDTMHSPLVAFKTGTWQHPDYPWLAASPDRYLYDVEYGDVYLLEAKSRQEDRDAKEPCDTHFTQCQLQLACVPEAKGLFYVSSNVRSDLTDTPTMICAIARNKDFVDKEVIPKLQQYRELVRTKTAPRKQARKPHFLSYRAASVKRVYPQ